MHTDTVQFQLEVDTRDIAYIVSTFEAYDYLAVVRTTDRERGLIELMVAPDFQDDTRRLLHALSSEISFRFLSENPEA